MIKLTHLPLEPGCYLFSDTHGEIIYVGKAKRLRDRVKQYFDKSPKTPKTQVLVKNITRVEYIIVGNEVEALLLENKLIKQHKPRYNIMLKDSKTYAYLELTAERYPRLLTSRKTNKKGEFFGPYTNGTARADTRKLAISVFQLRTCRQLPKKACLNYHIGLCTAPCIGAVSGEQYAAQVAGARELLKGKTGPLVKQLEQEMQLAAKKQLFEIALEKKNQKDAILHMQEKQAVDLLTTYDQDVIVMVEVEGRALFSLFSVKRGVITSRKEYRFEMQDDVYEGFLKAYYATQYIPREVLSNVAIEDETILSYLEKIRGGPVRIHVPVRGEKARLVQLAIKNIRKDDERLLELQDALNLVDIPRVIECFDISNIGSEIIVAGMTRWVDAQPDKDNYRKFEMKSVKTQDDFASMREVVYRRYSRLQEELVASPDTALGYPDLIIIDGGKGQLSSALWALKKLGLHIPIISLAKQDEEIFLPEESEPLHYDANSPMMLLVRAIRDSVHNFSVSYTRKKKQMLFSKQLRAHEDVYTTKPRK